MNATDKMADALAERDIALMRLEASMIRDSTAALRELEKEAVKILKRIDPTEPAAELHRRRRVKMYIKEFQAATTSAFAGLRASTASTLTEVAVLESAALGATTNEALGVNLIRRGLTPKEARAIADNLIVEGAPLADQWRGQRAALIERNRRGLTRGLIAHDTLTQLTQRVRGTRELKFADSLMRTAERNAATLIRTSVATTANRARFETYQKNGDLIKGVQADNPLDDATSPICQARAGMGWIMPSGDPFPGTGAAGSFPGAPPWHFNCRTVLSPIFRRLSQLRREVPESTKDEMLRLTASGRATLDGKPGAGMDFHSWLSRRSERAQKKILGPGKWQLWKSGKITTSQFIDQKGRPLTLAQLKAIAR